MFQSRRKHAAHNKAHELVHNNKEHITKWISTVNQYGTFGDMRFSSNTRTLLILH